MALPVTAPSRRPPVAGQTRRRRMSHSRRDAVTLVVMLGAPALLCGLFVWLPALLSVGLSFTNWQGVGGLSSIEPIGGENYRQITQNYPPFWPALQNNMLWLAFFLVIATPLGLLFAALLDKELKGTRFYQTAFFLPVVLSLALVGFIWQLLYSPGEGLINNLLGLDVDWIGNSDINIWAALVAASWRHVGYIMIIYLAGLKAVDSSLREAAAMDGANQVQSFFRVIFPAMRSTNIIVLVITVIEALRAFDLVYVLNRGRNGLELLSVLITDNIIGVATRIGFGSAIAVILLVISLGVIIPYLAVALKREPS